ncbi:hypothetical protein DL96DRAFT_1625966 [Flagelloscypha sp. PMI_526]|nr:hypothetical protein DL96DRAFT_1625966 [Flagelloscypha sp. PMI_526]
MQRENNANRARGRGRGNFNNNNPNHNPNFRGGYRGRGRGRGRGGFNPIGGADDVLDFAVSGPSSAWADSPQTPRPVPMAPRARGRDRPLLKPIVFVKANYCPRTFRGEHEEDLLQPLVASVAVDGGDDEPTASQVEKVFRQQAQDQDDDDSALEEIDFGDIGKMQEVVEKMALDEPRVASSSKSEHQEVFTGVLLKTLVPSNETHVIVEQETTVAVGGFAYETTETKITVDLSPTLDSPPSHGSPPPGLELENPPESYSDVDPTSSSAPIPNNTPIAVDTAPSTGDNILPEPIFTRGATPSPTPVDDNQPVTSTDPPTRNADPPEELFFVDSTPSSVVPDEQSSFPIGTTPSTSDFAPLGAVPANDDDDVIVYEAPNPSTRANSPPPPGPLADHQEEVVIVGGPRTSIQDIRFTAVSTEPKTTLQHLSQSPHASLKTKVRAKAALKRKAKSKNRRVSSTSFGRMGALAAEARLRGIDPRMAERRVGDDDLDWGDTDEDGDDVITGAEGMTVDVDVDSAVLQRFVQSLGKGHRMRSEDDEAPEEGTSEDEPDGGLEVEFKKEEEILIGEDPLDDDEDSDDEEFEERLKRLRHHTPSQKISVSDDEDQIVLEDEEDEEDWDEDGIELDEDDFFEQLEAIVGNISRSTRKGKRKAVQNALFDQIANGSFDLPEDDDDDDDDDVGPSQPARKRNKKPTHLPKSLQDQWEKDRLAKADRKRIRELERMIQASDPFVSKKGGKKGRKAMLRAASLAPSQYPLSSSNRVIDLTSLVVQVRRFVSMLGGPQEMVLPPCTKQTRKQIHEVANLKGKGDARYTTLTKTTRTVSALGKKEEKKLSWILRDGAGAGGGGDFVFKKGRGGPTGGGAKIRPREGEIVGSAAPKIGASNIGFKLLEMMGWTDGDRIGLTAATAAAKEGAGTALDAPLTAVVKTTKLGLGAPVK